MSAYRAEFNPTVIHWPCDVVGGFDGDERHLPDTPLFAAFGSSHQTKQESFDSDDFVGATGVALHLAREEVGVTKHLPNLNTAFASKHAPTRSPFAARQRGVWKTGNLPQSTQTILASYHLQKKLSLRISFARIRLIF
ncbi:hypothetical protein IV01_15315 [Pseudomonas syringae]|uniref:Uncharacterized protein n=1 Tax=Pseudomonas syringae TaxID=317 RepID=A0A085VGZ9_PSESX|nr:hypothetical protein IV01_15315 [Pseudomonas syringae]